MDAHPADPCPWCGLSLEDHTGTAQAVDEKTQQIVRVKCRVTARVDNPQPVRYIQGVTA